MPAVSRRAWSQQSSMIWAIPDRPRERMAANSHPAPRPFRVVVDLVAGAGTTCLGGADEVAGGNGHGGPALRGVGGEHQAAVERHVEPLVGVGDPRVCSINV